MEEKKQPRTFSGDVISRMLSDVEFEAFWAKYKQNRKSRGTRNRFQTERPVLNDQESKFLGEYFNNENKSLADLANEYNISKKSVGSYTIKLAMRVLWRNKERLEF